MCPSLACCSWWQMSVWTPVVVYALITARPYGYLNLQCDQQKRNCFNFSWEKALFHSLSTNSISHPFVWYAYWTFDAALGSAIIPPASHQKRSKGSRHTHTHTKREPESWALRIHVHLFCMTFLCFSLYRNHSLHAVNYSSIHSMHTRLHTHREWGTHRHHAVFNFYSLLHPEDNN